MSVKQFRARVQHKKKTEAEWYLDVYISAGSIELREDPFIPLDGELIIFEKDGTHENDRFKFGDGTNHVMELPFAYDSTIQALEKRIAFLEKIALTLDAPIIEVEGAEDEPDTPTGYYIAFSEEAAHQIEDKGAYVELDGVRTTVTSGKKYYCTTCKIAGREGWTMWYNLQYSGDCYINGDGYEGVGGWYNEFTTATINLNGNVSITEFQVK